MGGSIGVVSTLDQGSVFWVEFKTALAPQFTIPLADPAAAARPKARDGTPLRTLLYVEDNPANLELVGQLIERRTDLNMLSAADGALGIEYARASCRR